MTSKDFGAAAVTSNGGPSSLSAAASVAEQKPKASDLMPLGAALQVVDEARAYVGYDYQRDSSLALVVVEDERQHLLGQFRQVVAANQEYEAANESLRSQLAAALKALRPLVSDVRLSKLDHCLAAFSLLEYNAALVALGLATNPTMTTTMRYAGKSGAKKQL